ncbi:CobW family GTP-binding protein [Tabrizicola sp.]|uniref:CobW family GTP-binding protein n=1 Tax=Tabrizicola sp. TaxID=2005166 RepID=UPI003F2B8936
MAPRIPLTLITCYLGAGKTTRVNALLRDALAGRIAIVVNEFGDVGLDYDLIVETTEETVLLPSGCMCCTVQSDLVQAPEDLLDRRERGSLNFNRIVIETTGLADPAPILNTLIVTPSLGAALRLDGVVTVCDTANGSFTLDAGFEAVSQVAMADVNVISKADLVTPAQQAAFQARLSALAPGARQVVAANGAVPLTELFGAGPPEMGSDLPGTVDWINVPAYALSSLPVPALAPNMKTAGPTHGLFGLAPSRAFSPVMPPAPVARHDDRISAISATFDDPIHPMMLDIWVETLLASLGPNILRMKAVIWAKGFETPFVIHGVQHIIDPPVCLKA